MAKRTIPAKPAAREASLRFEMTEGARDGATGRAAFRMVMVQASGEAGVNAAVDLLRAAMTPRRLR